VSQSDPIPAHRPLRRGLFQSITTRLIVYFSLVFVVVIVCIEIIGMVGLPFTSYSGRRGQQREEAFRSLNLIADIKKERLARWLEERHDDTHVSATSALVRNNVNSLQARIRELDEQGVQGAELWALVRKEESYKILAEFMNNIKSTYETYDRIHIIDLATGEILVSTDKARVGDITSQYPAVSGCLEFDDSYIEDIEVSSRDINPALHISHSIEDKEGKSAAALIMHVNVDDIIKPMLHTGEGLGESGEALLVNKDVKILTALKHPLADGTRATPLEYQITAEPAVRAARGEEGIIEIEDYRGEMVLAARRHIRVSPDFGWGMVVKIDRKELFAPLQRDLAYSLLLGLTGVIAVVFLTIVAARNLTRPILSLSRTADGVAEGNLNDQAAVTTSDEVGQLAATFNRMVESIRERTAELTESNEQLEREITERKQVEEDLRSSEERLKILFEFAPDAYYLHDSEGKFVDGNRAAQELVGYNKRDLIGKGFAQLDILSPDQIEKAVDLLAKNSENLTTGPDEFSLNRKDGASLPIEIRTFPVQIGGQSLVLGIARDITARKQAEELLRQSEEKYRTLVDSIEIGFYETDLAGNFLFFNDAIRKTLGYSKKELSGMNYRRYVDEDNAGIIFRAFNNAYKTGEAEKGFNCTIVSKDGKETPVEFSVFLIRDERFNPVGFRGVTLDITERKKAEEELLEYRSHLEDLVRERTAKLATANKQLQQEITDRRNAEEALRDALEKSRRNAAEISALLKSSRATLKYQDFETVERAIFDACKNLVGATAGYIALLSTEETENEVLFLDAGGRPCTVDPDLPMPIRGLRAEAYRTGKPVYENGFGNSEWVKFMPPGHVQMDNVLFAPLTIEGKVVGVMGLANKPGDFTDNDARITAAFADHAAIALQNSRNLEALRKSEARYRALSEALEAMVQKKVAELQQAQSLAVLGRMVSVVAHEVRNPLQNIQMGVDVMRKEVGAEKNTLEIMEEIDYGVESLNNIVKDLLEYSRPVQLTHSFWPVGDIVRQALKTLAHKLHNINAHVELEPEDGEIYVDPIKFVAVLVNLISNAAEAMPGGGELRIKACFHNEDGQSILKLTIADNGCGIEEDHLDRIHEPFFTTKIKGTGLGIPICKKIIEAHKGRLDIRSEPNNGTTAEIRLPVGKA